MSDRQIEELKGQRYCDMPLYRFTSEVSVLRFETVVEECVGTCLVKLRDTESEE